MKSVLMVTPSYWPAVGGVETHVKHVIAKLSSRGYRFTVLTSNHTGKLPEDEIADNVRILRMPRYKKWQVYRTFRWMLEKRELLHSHDIIHVHGVTPFVLWYLPLRLIYYSKPVFCTYHGFERDPVPQYFKLLRKFTNRLVSKSICVGDFIEKVYRITCDDVVLGGVETTKDRQENAEGAIFVGRLEKDTGIAEHIRALEILKTRYGFSLETRVCGQGRLRSKIERMSREKGLDVSFLGTVENAQQEMCKSSLFLAGGYLSILEAMSIGLPVIGVAQTPLKFSYLNAIRAKGGSLSIQTKPEGVAEEIKNILTNSEVYDKIAKKGREFAARMSWDRLAFVYEKLWSLS